VIAVFEKNIYFYGKHAEYIKALTKNIEGITQGVFFSNLEVYLVAPIIGKIYGRKATVEKGESTSIHTEQINRVKEQLELNYRIIMLLDEKEKVDSEMRISRAFRYDRDEEKRKAGDEIFEEYALGGIEVLYEKVIQDAEDDSAYMKNLYKFVEEFNQLYYKDIEDDNIYDLCKLAGN